MEARFTIALFTMFAQAFLALLTALVVLGLYRRYKREYMRHWLASWWALSVMHLGSLVTLAFGLAPMDARHPAWLACSWVTMVAGFWQAAWMIWGALELATEKTLTRRQTVLLFAIPAAVCLVLVFQEIGPDASRQMRYFLRVGLREALTAAAFLAASVAVSRSRHWPAGNGRRLVLWGFVLYGVLHLWYVGYAVWRVVYQANAPNFIYYFGFVDFLLQTLMAFGVVTSHLEEQQREIQRAAEAERRLQERLRQSQKLETVGQLAGGIAHDFNNLLTVIMSRAESILAVSDREDVREDAEGIADTAERGAALTNQLLAYSRKQILKPQPLDVNRCVEGLRDILERLLGRGIALSVRLAPDLGQVMADPTQVDQVLVNLVVNARDAMPDGGRLVIRTEARTLQHDTPPLGAITLAAGPYVALTVSDTGHGMDEATLARVFEPYYSTKGLAKGHGLGLSTVQGIVRQSGGDVSIESRPGRGTDVLVLLPRIRDEAAEAAPLREERQDPEDAGRGETVLVVDDDQRVRSICKRVLQEAGYEVFTASQGQEALAVAAEHGGTINLLLTDVVMPVMNGADLAERFLAEHPETGVLFMSGYPEDVFEVRRVLRQDVGFQQKPFSSEQLRRSVRRALNNGFKTS